jgi:hypothetical protein
MGVDQASSRGLHVRISEHLNEKEKRVLTLRMVDDDKTSDPEARSAIRKLGLLMDTFNVKMCAIDHLPDGRMARALASAYPGRVMLVALSDVLKQPMSEVPKPQAAEQLVSVNRTVFLDATLGSVPVAAESVAAAAAVAAGLRGAAARAGAASGAAQGRAVDASVRVDGRRSLGDGGAVRRRGDGGVAVAVDERGVSEHMRQQEVQPPEPTPDFSEWEGKPWEAGVSAGRVPALTP